MFANCIYLLIIDIIALYVVMQKTRQHTAVECTAVYTTRVMIFYCYINCYYMLESVTINEYVLTRMMVIKTRNNEV